MAGAAGLALVPIENIQVFDYALAHTTINGTYGQTASAEDTHIGLLDQDPYTSAEQRERDKYALNETDWYEVTYEEVYGSSYCKLALHQDWITRKGYHLGAVVNMDLPEQGISGPFTITAVKHILPQKKPVDEDPTDDYDYRPVTGIFVHQSDDVWTLTFDSGETLGVTYNHPVYSVTAGGWRPAGELEIGERVLTLGGQAVVDLKEKRAGVHAVYNLEVREWHAFLVGDAGVLVHNAYLIKGCLDDEINYLRSGARFLLNGTGPYRQVRGHHPLAKAAFKGDPNYDLYDAFSVSTEVLGGQSIHNAITGKQNSLYSAWKNNNPNKIMTLSDMVGIELQAMIDAGIPADVASGWMVKALENLKEQGVTRITNIPWNGEN